MRDSCAEQLKKQTTVTFHLDELDHVRLVVGAHQGSGQKRRQQHSPLGGESIHRSRVRGCEGVGAVEGQEGG